MFLLMWPSVDFYNVTFSNVRTSRQFHCHLWHVSLGLESPVSMLDKIEERVDDHALRKRVSNHCGCRYPPESSDVSLNSIFSQAHNIDPLIAVLRNTLGAYDQLKQVIAISHVINGHKPKCMFLNFHDHRQRCLFEPGCDYAMSENLRQSH